MAGYDMGYDAGYDGTDRALAAIAAQSAQTGRDTDEEYETIEVLKLRRVMLGRQGENDTQTVVIDCDAWMPELSGCQLMIAAQRPGERAIYLPAVTVSGSVITWPILAQDTALAGWGRGEVRAMKDGKIRKSRLFATCVEPSLEGDGSANPPTPPDWAQAIMDAVETSARLVEEATACAVNAVRFDEPQDLGGTQQATARGNIGAAADADVDELKSALENDAKNIEGITGCRPLTFYPGYFRVPKTAGDVIDIDSRVKNNTVFISALDDCTEGDVYYVTLRGATGPQPAYAFLDSQRKVLTRGGNTENHLYLRNQKLIAPQNASYLVLNTHPTDVDVFAFKGGMSLKGLCGVTRNIWARNPSYIYTSHVALSLQPEYPAGSYVVSADVESDDTDVCYVSIYSSDTTFSSDNLIAKQNIGVGGRGSFAFTSDVPVRGIRFTAGGTEAEAEDKDQSVTNIQLEAGVIATPYVPVTSAIDYIARETTKYDEAQAVREVIDIKHGLVDYGYYNQIIPSNPSSSKEYLRLGIEKTGTQVKLNGTSANNYPIWIRLSGERIRRETSNAGVEAWATGLHLVSGHTYRLSAVLISGTVTREEEPYPSAFVLEAGSHTSVGVKTMDGFSAYRTFTSNGNDVNIGFYVYPETTFIDAVYQVILEDLQGNAGETDLEETNNLSANASVFGTSSALDGYVLLEISDGGTYRFEFDYKSGGAYGSVDGPCIVGLDANGEPVEITVSGSAKSSVQLTSYKYYAHKSFSVTFPTETKTIALTTNGTPSSSTVFYLANLKITREPKSAIRKFPDYYPMLSAHDHVARNELRFAGYAHDGCILRMPSAPEPLPEGFDGNPRSSPAGAPYGYNRFIRETWDTLLPGTALSPYDPDGADKAYSEARTKIYNVFVQRESKWKSTAVAAGDDEYNIYRYTFTPQNDYEKTIFLTAGCHGNEAEAYWGLYRLIRMIYFEGHKYPTLRNLRNTRIIVIPVWNPWGMQNYRRFNAYRQNRYQAWAWLFNPTHTVNVNGTPVYIDEVGEAYSVYQTLEEYSGALDLWIDFHTDPYAGRDTSGMTDIDDPRSYTNPYGFYGYAATNSKCFSRMCDVMWDFYNISKEECGFTETWHASNTYPGDSTFSQFQARLGFPCALVEVSTFMNGFPYASGSAGMMKLAQEFYGNCIAEMLR